MIIFNDAEYAKLIINGTAPPCINRNNILRSCVKAVGLGMFEYADMLNALQEHYPKLSVTEELFDEYMGKQSNLKAYSPHEVSFGLSELKNVNRMPRKLEKKYYLYQLFLFKYYGVHRLRVSQRELKRMANINPNHLSLGTFHLGRGITVRREKQTPTGTKILKNNKMNKPYTYYYPKERPGKTVFTYTYQGDAFLQPNIPFQSNLNELWDNFNEAVEIQL